MVSLQEGFTVLQPLVIFVIWMLAYTVFIFKFYKFVSRRNMFHVGRSLGGKWKKVAYAIKYVFLFPLTLFIWFFVIAALLATLSQVLVIGDIFMISMAVTVLIRITAYCDEDLSIDLAQLIPFSLLAVFLLDISKVSSDTLFNVYAQLPSALHILVYYFVFIVALELFMEISTYIGKKADTKAGSRH